MMKNFFQKIIFIFLIGFLFQINVLAVSTKCTYQDKASLNEIAGKVKTNYEVIETKEAVEVVNPDTLETEMGETTKTKFKISIYNLNENLYVTQTSDFAGEKEDIFYSQTNDGVYTFETDDMSNIIKYTYDVYSNIENCSGEKLKTYTFTKPKFNMYSQYGMCEGLEEVPYCRTYITQEVDISESALGQKVEEYIEKNDVQTGNKDENENTIWDFIKENYIYIISGVVLVSGATVVTIVTVKKRSAL